MMKWWNAPESAWALLLPGERDRLNRRWRFMFKVTGIAMISAVLLGAALPTSLILAWAFTGGAWMIAVALWSAHIIMDKRRTWLAPKRDRRL